MGASGTPGARVPAPGFTDSLGSRVIANGSGGTVELLTVAPDLASTPSFEAALHDGVSRVASFAHRSIGRVRRVERSPDDPAALTVHSDYVRGNRLFEILLIAQSQRLLINTSATLDILRQLVDAVAALHGHAVGIFHGALGPERLVVGPDSKVVVVEHVFGPALRRLPDRPPADTWAQLGLAVPTDPSIPRFGPRTDLVQIGMIALSLVVGRVLRPTEYPDRVPDLLRRANESDLVGNRRPLSRDLRAWIAALIDLDRERRIATVADAQQALESLLTDESRYIAAPIALDALLRPRHHRIRVVTSRASSDEGSPVAVAADPNGGVGAPATPEDVSLPAPTGPPSDAPWGGAELSEQVSATEAAADIEAPGRVADDTAEPGDAPELVCEDAAEPSESVSATDAVSASEGPGPAVEDAAEPGDAPELVCENAAEPGDAPELVCEDAAEPIESVSATDAVSASEGPGPAVDVDAVVAQPPSASAEADASRAVTDLLAQPVVQVDVPATVDVSPPIQSEGEPPPGRAVFPPAESAPAPQPAVLGWSLLADGLLLREAEPLPDAASSVQTTAELLASLPATDAEGPSHAAGIFAAPQERSGERPAPEAAPSGAPAAVPATEPATVPATVSVTSPATEPGHVPPTVSGDVPPAATADVAVAGRVPVEEPAASPAEAVPHAAEVEPDVIGAREAVPHTDRFSEWTPDANEAGYDLDAPLSARPRTRTTVASRRAPRESRARRLVMAAAAMALLAISGGVGAFWWQSRAGAGPPGTLEVSSEPPGTEVRIDGEPRGRTPLTLELRPGRYRVEVRAFGDVREATVDVAPGQSLTQSFSLALPSLTGSLEVTSRAANVEVVVDGRSRGLAPLTVADLPIGIHTVTLKSPRGEARHDVTIEAAKTATLDAADTGWVRIRSPLDLQILERGKVIGTAAGGPIRLSPGVHRLEFANADVKFTGSQVVQVASGKTTTVEVDPPRGSANFTSNPPSDVWVDGERVGATPVTNLSLALGPHEVSFRHPQFGELRYGVVVTLASPVQMSVDFRK